MNGVRKRAGFMMLMSRSHYVTIISMSFSSISTISNARCSLLDSSTRFTSSCRYIHYNPHNIDNLTRFNFIGAHQTLKIHEIERCGWHNVCMYLKNLSCRLNYYFKSMLHTCVTTITCQNLETFEFINQVLTNRIKMLVGCSLE